MFYFSGNFQDRVSLGLYEYSWSPILFIDPIERSLVKCTGKVVLTMFQRVQPRWTSVMFSGGYSHKAWFPACKETAQIVTSDVCSHKRGCGARYAMCHSLPRKKALLYPGKIGQVDPHIHSVGVTLSQDVGVALMIQLFHLSFIRITWRFESLYTCYTYKTTIVCNRFR